MYNSALHLGISIQCTNGFPTVDRLDLVPLLIHYDVKYMEERDEMWIYHVLRLHDHVRRIHLHLPPSILHKCLVLMDEHFPILEHLSLFFKGDNITTLTLPKAFLAPNLRHLSLSGICPSKRLRVLTSAVSLVTLQLRNIRSYFHPRLLVARLSSLPKLEKLSIGFDIPIPHPSTERELLSKQETPVTLPHLKYLEFLGDSAYLESLVAQIKVPLLERLHITFDQITSASPHLSHLINITEAFKLPAGDVFICRDEVFLNTAAHSPSMPGLLRLGVKSKQLDWQIDDVVQICSALIPTPTLSVVEELWLRFRYNVTIPEGYIEGTTWHELLRSFIGVKVLFIPEVLFAEISRVLRVDQAGSDPGFLPKLQFIVVADHPFSSFINSYRVVRHPFQLWEPFPGPPVDVI
jgi:hypothetical protein